MAEKKVRIDLNGTDPGKNDTIIYDQSPGSNPTVLLFPDATVDIQSGGHLNELTIKLHDWTSTEKSHVNGGRSVLRGGSWYSLSFRRWRCKIDPPRCWQSN